MNKITIAIIKAFTFFTVIETLSYSSFSFFEWQFNPGLWSEGARFIFSCFSFFVIIAAVFVFQDLIHENKQPKQ